jgi:hypothetical protein
MRSNEVRRTRARGGGAHRHAAESLDVRARSDRGGHGEPGVGKSRLFFEFKATSQSGWAVLETFSIPHGKALTLWQLGYPDQALKRDNEALVLALRQSQPFIVGFAELFAAVLRQYLRGAGAVQRHAESVIALSAEHELSDYSAFATTLRGWAIAEQGHYDEGIAQLQEGLNLF